MEVINNQVRKLLQTMLIHILLSPLHSGVGVKRANLTEEESDVIRQSNIANHQRGMQESAAQTHLAGACVIEHNINVLDINAPFLVNICSCVEKETCVQRCKDLIRHTLVTPKGVDYMGVCSTTPPHRWGWCGVVCHPHRWGWGGVVCHPP